MRLQKGIKTLAAAPAQIGKTPCCSSTLARGCLLNPLAQKLPQLIFPRSISLCSLTEIYCSGKAAAALCPRSRTILLLLGVSESFLAPFLVPWRLAPNGMWRALHYYCGVTHVCDATSVASGDVQSFIRRPLRPLPDFLPLALLLINQGPQRI